MNIPESRKDDIDYFDSIDVMPVIAIVLIITFLGYGFFKIVQIVQKPVEQINMEERNNEIQIGDFTDGKILDEKVRVIIEGDGKEQEIQEAIRTLIKEEQNILHFSN